MTPQIIPADPGNARTLAGHATEIRRLGKQAVSGVIEIGRLLVESKELVDHGDWLPWLSREFQWSDTTAERFMRVHKLSLKNGNLPNLDIPLSGLYLLAAQATPETAKQEAISRAEAGEPITLNAVKEIVELAKGVPTRIMTGKQVAKMVSRECRFRDCPPPSGAEATGTPARSPELRDSKYRVPVSPCTVKAIVKWRRREPVMFTLSGAVDRLVELGLEASAKRKEETLLALLTRVFGELEDRLEGSPGGKPPPYMAHLGGAITEVESAIKLIKMSGGR